jgi:hypothetical protein
MLAGNCLTQIFILGCLLLKIIRSLTQHSRKIFKTQITELNVIDMNSAGHHNDT